MIQLPKDSWIDISKELWFDATLNSNFNHSSHLGQSEKDYVTRIKKSESIGNFPQSRIWLNFHFWDSTQLYKTEYLCFIQSTLIFTDSSLSC